MQKEQFREWLPKHDVESKGSISDYIHYIGALEQHFGDLDQALGKVVGEFLEDISESNFPDKDKSKLSNHKSAVKKYLHFLLDTKSI